MDYHDSIFGKLSLNNGKGFEEVEVKFHLKFWIDEDGIIQASSNHSKIWVNVTDYDYETDIESPLVLELDIVKVQLSGYQRGTVNPESFEYIEASKTLILRYFNP